MYGTELDPRDVIAGELVPLLLNIRYGRQFDRGEREAARRDAEVRAALERRSTTSTR